MKRNIYLAFVLFNCFATLAQAQIHSKLDLRLWKRLHDGNIREQNMPLLVRGGMNSIKDLTERLGGIYKYGYNNISSVEIPERNLLLFGEDKAIEKIENTGAKGVFLMDTARMRNNVDSVHSGFSPLPNNLKGRNVVVGIIDGGIYWQHYDFRKPADSTTRIKFIWDQVTGGGSAPTPYNYGSEWTETDINNNTCSHSPPANDFGHGTCVAGIAAGNSLSLKGTAYDSLYRGVAPEADIIAVRVDNNNFASAVTDAVDYIFKKADALGKPCVINTSIGTYYGSHDGFDLTTQMIESLLDEHDGRVLVAAAGNAGNIPHHLGYDVPADSAYTYFTYNAALGYHYFDFWTDTADFNNAVFKVGASTNNGNIVNGTEYFSVPVDFNPPPDGNFVLVSRFLSNGPNTDEVYIAVTLDTIISPRYHVEFQIVTSDISNYWRLQTSGTGRLDAWASADVIGGSDMTSYLNGGIFITDPHYRHRDTLKTMVSSWQNSDKVITVGNYSNRAGYLDLNSNYIDLTVPPYNEVVGQKVNESSLGPTRDNRLKPDIMATGNTTISTGDVNHINLLIGSGQGYKVSVTGKHIRNGGTSMASPIVAGIAALFLELDPTATYSEIKQALICSATQDAFTGSLPNYSYGNGKVNAFAALTSPTCVTYGSADTACLNYNPLTSIDTGCVPKVYGCTDTGSINYNALANVDDGSCIPKVYGCMDTGSVNYNPLANVNGGGCIPKVYGCRDSIGGVEIIIRPLIPNVTIIPIPKAKSICAGSSVTFHALPGSLRGTADFQWKLNGANVGSNIPTYTTDSLVNNDVVGCVMSGNNICPESYVVTAPDVIAKVAACVLGSTGSVINTTCTGTSNGSINLTPHGGSKPYIYNWSNTATTEDISGLPAGSYSVTITDNAAATASASFTVGSGSVPSIPGSITSSDSLHGLCPAGISSVTYSIAPVTGASSYTWTSPKGTIITSGQGTTSVTVSYVTSFSSGYISVRANSACGSTEWSRLLVRSVLAAPGSISGYTNGLCRALLPSAVYYIFPVPGATSYTWTAPAGDTIKSGQGTTAVLVSFNSGFISGYLTVVANNACGSSAPSKLLLSSAPAALRSVSMSPDVVCSGQSGVTFLVAGVAGATSYNWTVPIGSSIVSGQGTPTIVVNLGVTGGIVSATASNSCGTSAAATKPISFTCKREGSEEEETIAIEEEETTADMRMLVYPNPAGSGSALYLLLNSSNEVEGKAIVRIYDIAGKLVYGKETVVRSNEAFEISNDFSSGMYIVEAVLQKKTFIQKLVIGGNN